MPNKDEDRITEAENRQVQTVLNLFRASTLMSRIGGKISSQVGLASAQQWVILGTIARAEGIALKDLRVNTLVTKQNISSMIDRLRQAGYVVTYEDTADRRITRVRLTEAGREVLKALRPLYLASNERTFEVFDTEELTVFASLLDRLVVHLSKQEESLE